MIKFSENYIEPHGVPRNIRLDQNAVLQEIVKNFCKQKILTLLQHLQTIIEELY